MATSTSTTTSLSAGGTTSTSPILSIPPASSLQIPAMTGTGVASASSSNTALASFQGPSAASLPSTTSSNPATFGGASTGRPSNSAIPTAAITSSDSSTATSSPESGTTFGNGAAAGFSIGFFILGALLAAATTAWFFTRRSKKRAQPWNDGTPESAPMQLSEKTPAVAAAALGGGSAAAIVEEFLPLPREDSAIRSDLSSLKTRIDAHINEYYVLSTSNLQAASNAITQAVGSAAPIPAARIAASLSHQRTNNTLLQAALSWVIFSRIGPDAAPDSTLLPPEIAGMHKVPPSGRMSDDVHEVFTSKWRQITAALAGDRLTSDLRATDTRLSAVSNTTQAADSFLGHFARPGNQQERVQKLQEIVKRAARFDAMLFAQAITYHFDWSGSESRMVIFPGLVQRRGENGQLLSRPNVLVRQESEAYP